MNLIDRIKGAVWGQFVGDAACLGTHWIYDLDELERRYPAVEGFEAPIEGHYHDGKQPGEQTHYGDAALLLLESIAATGAFDEKDFGRRFVALFGSADYQGYRDHATKGMLANYLEQGGPDFDFQQGTGDEQPATVTRLAPLVAAHRHDPRLRDVVRTLTQVCQNSHRAVAYAQAHARILNGLIKGENLPAVCRQVSTEMAGGYPVEAEVAEQLQSALEKADLNVQKATLEFGQACPLLRTFPSAMQTALHHADDYTQAILAALKAGGDNAARCAMIGAWLGASLGFDAIPSHWRNRLSAKDRIERAMTTLLGRFKPES